MKVKQGRK